jgi:hypothetical protein
MSDSDPGSGSRFFQRSDPDPSKWIRSENTAEPYKNDAAPQHYNLLHDEFCTVAFSLKRNVG